MWRRIEKKKKKGKNGEHNVELEDEERWRERKEGKSN